MTRRQRKRAERRKNLRLWHTTKRWPRNKRMWFMIRLIWSEVYSEGLREFIRPRPLLVTARESLLTDVHICYARGGFDV
jgi:hypothetical protein